MLRSGSPKKLWDHSLELEGAVRSHTCLDIYALDGQVPETVMMGQTADISHLCEYEWFDWVMYYEPVNGYPNDKVTIGRYLGPAIDVGTAMTMKILKPNGGYVCRSTVRPWTKEEEANPIHIANRTDFMTTVHDNLGPVCTVTDFAEDDLTPKLEHYSDGDNSGFEGTLIISSSPLLK